MPLDQTPLDDAELAMIELRANARRGSNRNGEVSCVVLTTTELKRLIIMARKAPKESES